MGSRIELSTSADTPEASLRTDSAIPSATNGAASAAANDIIMSLWRPSGERPKLRGKWRRAIEELLDPRDDRALYWGLEPGEDWKDSARNEPSDFESSGTMYGAEDGLWSIALAQRLPALRKRTTVDEWSGIVSGLLRTAEDAQRAMAYPDDWVAQLYAVELGLTLWWQCPEFPDCQRAGEASLVAAEEGLLQQITPSGTPVRLVRRRWLPYFASWIRCLTLLRGLCGPLPKQARERFEFLTRQVLRQVQSRRGLAFQTSGPRMEKSAWRAMFTAARRLISDPLDRQWLDEVILKKRSSHRTASSSLAAIASHYDEIAGDARLSQGLKPKGIQLFVDHRRRHLAMELWADRKRILTGDFEPRIRRNGQSLERDGEWSLQCWYTEPEADYLELELPLTANCRLQRQFLLSKRDSLVFLADAMLADTPGAWEYEFAWPLADGCEFLPAAETRDGELHIQGTKFATMVPLALPEWRTERAEGQLSATSSGPRLEIRGRGEALYAPLALIMGPAGRRSMETTWRRLTVAESLRRVSPDVAAGYRLQHGRRQWLVYKSLTHFGNRTVLGQNFALDFACNRFLPDGSTKTIVEVEIDGETGDG